MLSGQATFGNSDFPTFNLNYPSGLNASNCVVVSSYATNITNPTGYYSYGTLPASTGYVIGAIFVAVAFKSDVMQVRMANPTNDAPTSGSSTFGVKLVLMKI